MKGLMRTLLGVVALAVAPFVLAQQEPQVSSFLEVAAQDNIAEVEMAEMAQERAASDDVKYYAKQIQQSHELAQERLEAIAEKKNVELPDEPGKMHKQEAQQLSQFEGEQFDRQYVQTMVQGHKKAIEKFEQQAQSAQDPEVKQYAKQTLPTLRAHLEMGQQLQQQMQAQRTQAPQQKQEQRQ